MISLLSPGKAPLDLAGASRVHIIVRSRYQRLARMPFSCSRENLAGYTQSNFTKAFEIALRLAFSFRRSVLLHAHNKAWSNEHGTQRNSASGAQSHE